MGHFSVDTEKYFAIKCQDFMTNGIITSVGLMFSAVKYFSPLHGCKHHIILCTIWYFTSTYWPSLY